MKPDCSSDFCLPLLMGDDATKYDEDSDVLVAPSKPKLKPPSMYNVVMHNDDYTPMEFVVEVLEVFFGHDRESATRVMLTVHTSGKAVCGTYTRDVAETKMYQVNQFAQQNQHPLLCEIEVVSDEQ